MEQREFNCDYESSIANGRSTEQNGIKPSLVKRRDKRSSAGAAVVTGANIPATAAKRIALWGPPVFLAQAGLGRTLLDIEKGQSIFSQGDAAEAVFYLRSGRVRISVVSKEGKEATIALLSEGDFLGEECIANAQPSRLTTATALTEVAILKIEKRQMLRALTEQPALSDVFVAYLLLRNRRAQENLVDQLFNSSEKRLARVLLQFAQFGKESTPETAVPKISQEVLAEMIGTTRSRVSFFMNRFRKLGFIEYKDKLTVHSSLLEVVLHD
ncbi:MAG TPA: Crp/Fnr family transcriptional regulator [Candidatus Saccharimonadales bacterium]|jgi:CRP/FNR family cyclic AMP-dependent transcriptional regulator|nr:Crp/Fnr family transcriptional regulator [Candidatus Saccharimonadales bacterium]